MMIQTTRSAKGVPPAEFRNWSSAWFPKLLVGDSIIYLSSSLCNEILVTYSIAYAVRKWTVPSGSSAVDSSFCTVSSKLHNNFPTRVKRLRWILIAPWDIFIVHEVENMIKMSGKMTPRALYRSKTGNRFWNEAIELTALAKLFNSTATCSTVARKQLSSLTSLTPSSAQKIASPREIY